MPAKVDLSFLLPKFLERLDERLRRLERALDTIVAASMSEVEAVMRDFHSLAGIGGTYGFPQVTALAHQGELLLARTIREKRCVESAEAAGIRALVSQMESQRQHGCRQLLNRAQR